MTPRRANLLAKADRMVAAGNRSGCTIWLCQVTNEIRALATEVRRLDKRVDTLEARVRVLEASAAQMHIGTGQP
jgi:outer membrane murein-binding lipoprotein Lpp